MSLELKEKLTSRKLWMAIIAAVYFASQGDANQALASIMMYIGAQAHIDAQKQNQ